MNTLSQILVSATAGGLVTLALTVSPPLAQNKTIAPSPVPSPHSTPGMPDHSKMMEDMSQMMEKCQSMMGDRSSQTTPQGPQHERHHPGTKNPT